MQEKIGSLIIVLALLYGGYHIVENWAIGQYGVVPVWAFKRHLLSPATLVCGAVAILGLYISTKLKSPQMLIAIVGIAAVVPFGIWLYNYLGSKYFNIIGKTFFYTATTGISGWALFMILSAPIGVIKRFRQFSEERHAKTKVYEAKAMSILSDAKGRYRQSQYITVAGRAALAIDTETGNTQWFEAKNRADKQEDVEENPLSQIPADALFQQIYDNTAGLQNCPSLIVAGKKRSGKSTFLSWITRTYADEVDFIVYDPKLPDPTVKWGATTIVIGQNQDFQGIADDIDRQIAIIKTLKVDPHRRKKIFIFDEWLTLIGLNKSKKDKDLNPHGAKIFQFGNKILTELSYLGIGAVWSPHTTTCTGLGFPSGLGQLKSNFDGIFRFHYNLLTKVRKSYFEVDEEEFELPLWNPRTAVRGTGAHPHTHTENAQKGPFEPLPERCAGVRNGDIALHDWRAEKPVSQQITDFYESKQDKKIVDAHRAGKSNRQIIKELDWSMGGDSNQKINAVLKKYGMRTGV